MTEYAAANFLKPGKNPYDIHCYWPLGDSAARAKALELHEKTHKRFPWLTRLPIFEEPRGPHSCPYWEADFGAGNEDKHAEVLSWLRENYDSSDKECSKLSLLLHPNTTLGAVTDHRPPHAIWVGGKPIELYEYMFNRGGMKDYPPAKYLKAGRNPYDIHCYWPLGDSDARAKALELHEKTHKRFPWLIRLPVFEKPRGPHSCPYWEADFGAGNEDKHAEVLSWLRENYNSKDETCAKLSILLHPNTTKGVITDHRTPHAIWIGEPIALYEYMFYGLYVAGATAAIVAIAAVAIAASKAKSLLF